MRLGNAGIQRLKERSPSWRFRGWFYTTEITGLEHQIIRSPTSFCMKFPGVIPYGGPNVSKLELLERYRRRQAPQRMRVGGSCSKRFRNGIRICRTPLHHRDYLNRRVSHMQCGKASLLIDCVGEPRYKASPPVSRAMSLSISFPQTCHPVVL